MSSNPITIEPIAGALGAELRGVDLSQPLSDGTFRQVAQALVDNEVIFFRDQELSPARHKTLAARFGPLQQHLAYPHPKGYPEVTILEHSAEKPSKIEKWHADMTFMAQPPLGSLLYAQVVPERGGDTLWSSMTAAYEGLSAPMQRFLSGLTAIHDFKHGFRESLAEPGGPERLKDAIAANPPQEHPVIRTHPVSGRALLFVNSLFTTHIVGLKAAESEALLTFLWEHAIQPEYTCRFRWQPGSLAFWDNRATQHKPVNDHGLARRKFHRVTVEGDRPI